jgi:methionine-rich copper-binding protein CopC
MRIRRWSPLILTLAALPLIGAAKIRERSAHILLEYAVPGKVVEASPPTIELWFTQDPLPNETRIRLFDAAGKEQPLGDVVGDPENPYHFIAAIRQKLPNGTYKVFWRTMSDDEPGGFVREDKFDFTVQAP